MRTLLTSAAALTLTACTVVVQPAQTGTTSPAPARAPEPVVPLEVTLARPVNGRLLVQTNRPAYVAIFEIVPGHGVALMQPANVRQRTVTYSGMNWVPATWTTERASRPASRVRSAPVVHQAAAPRARYVYALASDRPLSIPDEAFQPDGMQALLGASAYNASSPAVTMRTIARGFVPRVRDEAWAEDAVLISASYEERPSTTVRVYCGRGTVHRVPAEVADRVWCPAVAGPTSRPASPDSVMHDNGRRVQRRPALPPGRGIDRVAELPVDEDDRPGNGVGRPDDRPGNGVGRPDDRGDNGRKLGHTDPTKPGGGRPAETGRAEQAGQPATPASDTARNNRGVGNNDRGNAGGMRPMAVPARRAPDPVQTDTPADSSAKPANPEDKGKPEDKAKPEDKGKPEDKAKPDEKGKPEDKAKPDDKGKPDSTAAKPDSSRRAAPGRSRRPS